MTSPSPEQTSATQKEKYEIGDRVWVKVDRQPWWPAEVVEDEHNSRPVIVKHFEEEKYESVSDPVSICLYNCPMREKYKLEGLRWGMSRDRRELFKVALKLAENGDEKELDSTFSDQMEGSTAMSEANSSLSVTMDTKEKLETEATENVNEETNFTDICVQSECPQNSTPKVECVGEVTHQKSPFRASEENSHDPQQLSNQLSQFTCGVSVWVKLVNTPWWPARVIEVTQIGNKSAICVEFFNENAIEEIKDLKKIKAFDCQEKEKFCCRGVHTIQSQEKKALFRDAYDMAVMNTSGKTVSDVCLRKQIFGDQNCSGPGNDSHETEEPLVTPVRRKRGTSREEGSSVKRRKTHKDELSNVEVNESDISTNEKRLCLSRGTQRNKRSKCSVSTKLEMHCKRTTMNRSESQGKTLGCDPSTENKLPCPINQSNTRRGQSNSKFTRRKNTKKKTRKKGCTKKKMEGERNKDLCKEKDTVYSEASSPIPYNGNVDAEKYTVCHETNSPIPYNGNVDAEKYTVCHETSSPIPYNGNVDAENSSDTETTQSNKPSIEMIQQSSSFSKDIQNGEGSTCSVSSGLKTRKRGKKMSNNSKSAKSVKKLGEGETPLCCDSVENELPILINHAKLKKGRSQNTSSKITRRKKTKKKKWGEKDIQKEINWERKAEYTEASSPILYSGNLDSGQWSSLQDHLNPSQDAVNPLSSVCSLDGTENRQPNSNAKIQQLNIPTEDRGREDFDPNLDVDDCYISESDGEDLPDALTPSRHAAIHEKDIVWVKWRSCPVWPAVVRRLEKKKKRIVKISLFVIEPHPWIPKKLRIGYSQKSIFPYNSKDSDLFLDQGNNLEDEGRKRFMKAVDMVENYMTKRILGTLRKEDMEFMDCHEGVDEVLESSPPPSPVTVGVSPPDSPVSNPSVDSNESVILLGAEGPKFDPLIASRYEKIKERNRSLVEFLKSSEVKQYLLEILWEKRKSDKHMVYKLGRSKERDRLKNPGFGPIADEDQQEDVLYTMMEWYRQETKLSDNEIPDVSYVIDVWIPEGIVYGLMKRKKYTRKKAWEQFEKGVYMTKKEKAEVHRSLLESAKRISPEDVQRYEANIQDRINVICHQSGLQNITL